MKREPRRSISVEDLLRLKRAEQPLPEFWQEFDRRLREKQLSALVAPKPWWQRMGLAGAWGSLRRIQVPLGAAAIVTVTIASWPFQQSQTVPEPIADVSDASTVGAKVSPIVESRAAQEPPGALVAMRGVVPEVVMSTGTGGATEPGPVVVDSSTAPLPRDIPLLGAPGMESKESLAPWTARLDSPLGAQNEVAEVQLSRSLLSSVTRFEARLPAARSPVEPLKQITPPGERRGARILTAMVSVGSVENAMRTTERAASRLSEERLYDQIQRFGARGAGVSLKF
jgi:hypothetical protein